MQEPQQAAQEATLRRGASDLLRIAASENGDDANPQFKLVHEHILQFGDRAVHFSSSDVYEVIDATPTQRILVVTERAVYKFPMSAPQTGLFFDARFPVASVVQVVAVDNDDSLQGHGLNGLDAQLFIKSEAGSVVLAFTLNFGQVLSRRQAFFLSLSLVKPGLPILLKRRVNNVGDEQAAATATEQQKQANNSTPARGGGGAKSPTSGRRTPHYLTNTKSSATKLGASPAPQTPLGGSAIALNNNRGLESPGSNRRPLVAGAAGAGSKAQSSATGGSSYSPAAFRDAAPSASAGGAASTAPDSARPAAAAVTAASANAPTVSADEYERQRKQLHVLLMFDLSPANQLDMLDPGWRSGFRPPEEGVERINERDEIRAMIYAKEDKIELDARFREKNPKKALTKFARGVCLEFDKAHEERFVPPELSDEMLLGPALFPLWRQWKNSGGLLKVDRSGGDDEDQRWTLFDTNDLISSIRAQEDALLGQIGKKSMVRLQQMRELVEREKKMFMNRNTSTSSRGNSNKSRSADDNDRDDDDDGASSNGNKRNGNPFRPTRPVPFRLSCSPNLERSVKRQSAHTEGLDLGSVMRNMKDTLMVHRAKLHELQKTQLIREINRQAKS